MSTIFAYSTPTGLTDRYELAHIVTHLIVTHRGCFLWNGAEALEIGNFIAVLDFLRKNRIMEIHRTVADAKAMKIAFGRVQREA